MIEFYKKNDNKYLIYMNKKVKVGLVIKIMMIIMNKFLFLMYFMNKVIYLLNYNIKHY